MTAALFLITVCCALFFFYKGTGRNKTLLLMSAAWTTGIAVLAGAGFFRAAVMQPFRMLVIFLPAIIFCIQAYRKTDSAAVNIKYLLALHVLRVPVEIVLYRLSLQKQVPELMTFAGWNFDIISGITAALLLLYMLLSGKRPNAQLIFAWNITGLILLAVIVLLAILSAPLPFQQLAFTQPNIAVLDFPYTLLPAYVVPAVLTAHLLALKMSKHKS